MAGRSSNARPGGATQGGSVNDTGLVRSDPVGPVGTFRPASWAKRRPKTKRVPVQKGGRAKSGFRLTKPCCRWWAGAPGTGPPTLPHGGHERGRQGGRAAADGEPAASQEARLYPTSQGAPKRPGAPPPQDATGRARRAGSTAPIARRSWPIGSQLAKRRIGSVQPASTNRPMRSVTSSAVPVTSRQRR